MLADLLVYQGLGFDPSNHTGDKNRGHPLGLISVPRRQAYYSLKIYSALKHFLIELK